MSRQYQPLLIELGTEELPPKALSALSQAFTATLSDSLREAGMLGQDASIHSYATPRRLALTISAVADTQEDFTQTRKGPAVKAAFDAQGKPTRAAEGFAKSCAVSVAELGREQTDRGEWLIFEQTITGKNITECAQQALDEAIERMPIPRRMRWGERNVEFVRPVHWLVALHGQQVLALKALGLTAGNRSRGHRFHHPDEIVIERVERYRQALQDAYVVADYAERQELIRQQTRQLAEGISGIAVLDDDLLDEVTGLVEWPVAILGSFDQRFLDVPREVLVAAMKDHQKYFYVTDRDGELLAKFITVSNIESSTPEKVLSGNERVLQARLSDAQFFWDLDRQQRMENNAGRLEKLLFHIKLGSMADKTRRLASISGQLAGLIGADADAAEQAAQLCKLDLVSLMVGEFASLQGTMGRYYALNEGKQEQIANAIEQHYWPKFAGDRLPESGVATALALADRMDALVGIFATGERPSGVKDPYALRRAALGVLRMLIENDLDISLETLIEITVAAYRNTPGLDIQFGPEMQQDLEQFILDRLRAHYTGTGFDINSYNAVAEVRPAYVSDFDRRIRAISEFFDTQKQAATSLAAANKRIANILKKTDSVTAEFDHALFEEDAERELARALEKLSSSTQKAFAAQQYAQGLTQLSGLETPVNRFFDEVRVMDDNPAVRHNRLALLSALRNLFLRVADISHLNPET